jgi:hypothetical protein
MTISRRNFLRQGTLVSLSTIATLSAANLAFGQSFSKQKNRPEIFQVPREVEYATLNNITRQMFADAVNSTFVITHPVHGRVETYLKEVEDLRPPAFKNNPTTGHESFNLIFVSQSGIEFSQGTYDMEHEKLGRFELFIVPGVSRRYGRNYGASINRLFP